jgi:hypothetical protein
VHTQYPGSDIRKCGTIEEYLIFDACRPLEPGERYEFVFRQSGGWGFHDHLEESFFGGVDVPPVEDYRPPFVAPSVFFWKVFDNLFDITRNASVRGLNLFRMEFSAARLGAYEKDDLASSKDYERESVFTVAVDDLEVRRMIHQLGASRVLEKLVKESETSSQSCHRQAHYIGWAVYDLFGVEGVTECSDVCVFGCYHGAMELMFADSGQGVSNDVERLCASLDTIYGRYQCFHGMGHGFFTFLQADLPKAIDACKTLDENSAQEACYGGVFMENGVAAYGKSIGNEGHLSEWLSWTDVHYPCGLFESDLKVQEWCYALQGSWMYVVRGHDFDAAIVDCMDAPRSMIGRCMESLGRNFGARYRYDAVRTESYCASMPDRYYEDCIFGATKALIHEGGASPDNKTPELCKSFETTRAKDACNTLFIQSVYEFFANDSTRLVFCPKLEAPYDDQCVQFIEGGGLKP